MYGDDPTCVVVVESQKIVNYVLSSVRKSDIQLQADADTFIQITMSSANDFK